MKKITLTLLFVFITFISFSQDTEAPTAPTNLNAIFYQNDNGTNILYWNNATDNVAVTAYDIYVNDNFHITVPHLDGQSQQDVLIEGLFGLSYCFYVVARDAAQNTSETSNTDCFHRNPSTSDQFPDDLYLSAIVNGDSNNKIIEISNLTDINANLDNYSIKISRDGNATWQDTYTFPSGHILNDLDAFVIGRSTGTFCADEYDVIDDIITDFDGNDVIGFFKNDVLIQSYGTLGDSSVIMNANTAYTVNTGAIELNYFDINFWTEMDLATPLGSICYYYIGTTEFIVLSTEDNTQNSFSIYPNPTNGDIVTIDTKNNVEITAVKVFDLTGKQVLQQTNVSNEINVQGLQQGVYILQIESDNKLTTKKLIRQ
ncbi:T9SS type A sorting domain-containing protein [uncultured Kordia sp.]|uniref:T9SS type A sorting domain-containing protein n=1 Tax=uncultured Kordia sp. TaxID=507699 RepID=UPI0026023FB1|nr:T9SS type A sorting domain-containing protein [uncultured Kordia sp.]